MTAFLSFAFLHIPVAIERVTSDDGMRGRNGTGL
jgi:hypothetical protein